MRNTKKSVFMLYVVYLSTAMALQLAQPHPNDSQPHPQVPTVLRQPRQLRQYRQPGLSREHTLDARPSACYMYPRYEAVPIGSAGLSRIRLTTYTIRTDPPNQTIIQSTNATDQSINKPIEGERPRGFWRVGGNPESGQKSGARKVEIWNPGRIRQYQVEGSSEGCSGWREVGGGSR